MNENLQVVSELISNESSLNRSFVDDLFTVMANRQFINAANKINLEAEECIGKLNTLEKSIVTLISKYIKCEKELVEISFKNSINGESTEPKKQQERDLDLYKTRTRYEIAQSLLLSSIVDRFSLSTDIDIKEYGYRANNEIVLVREESIISGKAKIANTFMLHAEPLCSM